MYVELCVNSGIESRGPRVVSPLQEDRRIGEEKERQNRGGRAGCTRVTGGMSGMLRICEKGRDRRIVLARAKFEVRVFGIPGPQCLPGRAPARLDRQTSLAQAGRRFVTCNRRDQGHRTQKLTTNSVG